MDSEISHLDGEGRARMVDTSGKDVTLRRARAVGHLQVAPETSRRFREGRLAKGDAAAVARIAAIQGAKRTAEWIPLCHPLRLDAVEVGVRAADEGLLTVEVTVVARERTGVEMEALCAVSAGLLALYDMVKGIDRGATVERVRLLEKEGGRSGRWRRETDDDGR